MGSSLAQPLGAGDGVELVAALGQARRGVEVVVGAERHDQEVGLVHARVGRDACARAGSIAVIVSRRKRTPGLAISR